MEDPRVTEIFEIMGELKNKFNEHISGNITRRQVKEDVESNNFIARYSHFAISGGRLIPGQNLINENGIATVNQGLNFRIQILPKNVNTAEPLRLEVDNPHRIGSNKIIHINPAGGDPCQIPNDLVEDISPGRTIDLVRISGSIQFLEAIHQSFEYWGL